MLANCSNTEFNFYITCGHWDQIVFGNIVCESYRTRVPSARECFEERYPTIKRSINWGHVWWCIVLVCWYKVASDQQRRPLVAVFSRCSVVHWPVSCNSNIDYCKVKLCTRDWRPGNQTVFIHMWQSRIEINPSHISSTLPSLAHYRAELPLRVGLIRDM